MTPDHDELREAVAKLATIVAELVNYENYGRLSFRDCEKLSYEAADIARQFSQPREEQT